MSIWTLETESNSTKFSIPIEEDKQLFHELVENYFDLSKPIEKKWRSILMLRSEPSKYTDFYEVDGTDVIAFSQKAVDVLREYLSKKVELLPIETDAGIFYAINILNFVDCLNIEESVFTATPNGVIVRYESLEFDEAKLSGNEIFKIPELPYRTFITDNIQRLCENDDIRGLVFDSNLNLVWYPQ